MADKKVLGQSSAKCPACGAEGEAEARQGSNGRAYIIFDCCTSMFRTLSGRGDRGIRSSLPASAPAAVDPVPAAPVAETPAEPKPEKKPEKKRGMFSDALDVLGGGR